MKKQLLVAAVFLFPLFAANAQQSYATDFFIDPGYSGFSTGTINNQNGWQTLTTGNLSITGCNILSDAPLSLTSGWSYSPQGVLSVAADTDFEPSQNGSTFKCFSPLLINGPVVTQSGSLAILTLIDTDDSPETIGAVYEIEMLDGDSVTSKIGYFPDSSIKVLDVVNGTETYVTTNYTWAEQEWAQLTIDYNFINHTINYIINGQVIYSGNTLAGQQLQRFAIVHDNEPGSTAYYDDIFIFAGQSTAGINKVSPANFSLYPNPTTRIVTLSNTNNALLVNATITDTNGRLIRSQPLNTSSEAQINLEGLSAGMYILTVNSDKGLSSHKVVKY